MQALRPPNTEKDYFLESNFGSETKYSSAEERKVDSPSICPEAKAKIHTKTHKTPHQTIKNM